MILLKMVKAINFVMYISQRKEGRKEIKENRFSVSTAPLPVAVHLHRQGTRGQPRLKHGTVHMAMCPRQLHH